MAKHKRPVPKPRVQQENDSGGDMAMTPRQEAEPVDDYHVEGREEVYLPTIGARIAYILRMLMVLVMAVLSFAIFWVVGLTLNIL